MEDIKLPEKDKLKLIEKIVNDDGLYALNEYLQSLKQWKDEQVIKVVTGIRRCGKSTLLTQYQEWLKTEGITDDQIISVNFEELEYEELLGEIYAIVKSGTRLNIDYYIDDLMDEDHMLDIYEYFRDESETDSIDEAMDELGSDYTEEEIRLVRIKFMSETAN